MIDTPSRRMSWPREVYSSQVGKKAVMALTGVVLFGYVLLHMVGNLKLYQGRSSLNHYAEWLREVGGPLLPAGGLLWIVRGVLTVSLVLHVMASAQLTVANRKARPVGYRNRTDYVAASYASRTMRWSGVIVGLFVAYHLMHFTWGNAHPDFVKGDVYHNVVAGFRVPAVSGFYIAAQLALGLHLYHGLWSLFQSLGLNNLRFNRWRNGFAKAFAAVVTLGNVSFPVLVLARVVR